MIPRNAATPPPAAPDKRICGSTGPASTPAPFESRPERLDRAGPRAQDAPGSRRYIPRPRIPILSAPDNRESERIPSALQSDS